MSKEIIILISAWIIMTIILLLFVPKNKLREAITIFFFKQTLTWILGLTVAHFKFIEYPVRSFSNATSASFDFEYYFYPVICIIFNLYYPMSGSRFQQFMHYFYYCSAITSIEAILENYTNLIKYINWTWYITWISFFITFYLSHRFYVWFFRLKDNTKIFSRT